MTAQPLRRLRVRAHVPAAQPTAARRPHLPRPGDPAFLVHVLADERDRVVLATAREVMLTASGAVTISERFYAPAEHLTSLAERAAGLRPDVAAGYGVKPVAVAEIGTLGRLFTNRGYRQRWPLVGYDLPWTVNRLAAHAGPTRRGDGFSVSLVGSGTINDTGVWVPSWYYPRLTSVPIGGDGGAFLNWTTPKAADNRYHGHRRAAFVDLAVLAGVLAGGPVDGLQHAAELFNVTCLLDAGDPLDRLRAEAATLVECYGRGVWALAEAAPGLSPDAAYTFGSLATHALRNAGVRSPLAKAAKVPDRDLGAAASACFGGRFECRLPGVLLPMVLRDVRSTYPSVAALLGAARVYSCQSIRSVQRDPAELLGLLADPARLYHPDAWRDFGLTFVTIRPHGEPLPASVELTAGDWRTLVAPLHLSGGTATYHWCDLAAAVAEGADPAGFDIVRVFELRPSGTEPDLRPLQLPSGRLVDLAGVDLAAALVADRQTVRTDGPRWRGGLTKAVANALTYGALARHDRKWSARPVDAAAIGPAGEPLTVRTSHREDPGPYTFLPAAAAVCAGARLILALARRGVVAAGSEVVAMHADSIAVPCSVEGGIVEMPGAPEDKLRVMRFAELAAVLDRFKPLGVHFKDEVGTPVEPTVGLAVAVNRVVFAGSDGTVVRSSDAGLGGHLADPSDTPDALTDDGHQRWAAELEHAALAGVITGKVTSTAATNVDARDRPLTAFLDRDLLPGWAAGRPVIRRYSATTMPALRRLREQSGDPTVSPFARYLRADVGAGRAVPLAVGLWPDARLWGGADWRMNGQPVRLSAVDRNGDLLNLTTSGRARTWLNVRTVDEYFDGWLRFEDPSTTGPTRGLRRPVDVHSAPGLVVVTGRDGAELAAMPFS